MMSTKANCVIYERISDKDQSYHSLDEQHEANEEYAEELNWSVLAHFTDDGVSAKDFERPGWRACEEFVRLNNVQFVLLSTYDRLIRNLEEGLKMLRQLETEMGVMIVASEELINAHPDDPKYFTERANLLLQAEVERLNISSKTKRGMRQAMKKGYYLFKAPYGYRNVKDEFNKPTLEVIPKQADLVRSLFRMATTGISNKELRERMRSKGWNIKGNSSIVRTLTNKAYAGLIKVPKYKFKKEMIVRSKHEAIIQIGLFDRVQFRLQKGSKQVYYQPEIPQRGFVRCGQCSNLMTGYIKKDIYPFYKCSKHSGNNISGNIAQAWLLDIFRVLSFSPSLIKQVDKLARERLKGQHRVNELNQERGSKRIQALKRKLDSLLEKFVDEDIDRTTYRRKKNEYEMELRECVQLVERGDKSRQLFWSTYREVLPRMERMDFLYSQMRVPEKHQLLGHIFSNGLFLDKKGYRTESINPIFLNNAVKASELEFLEVERIETDFASIPLSSP